MTSSPILQRDTNTVTIATFYENYLLGKYNFDPAYQRRSVWNEEKQSFFIDSILKNFPIPAIFLHQHIDEHNGKTTYDVIDGKQRLQALTKFINNEIPVSNEQTHGDAFNDPKLAGATFDDLNTPELAAYKGLFWRYAIPVEYIDTTSSDVIDDIFDRLNRNGEKLTGQELRNARYHGTPFLELVQRLTKVKFWAELLKNVDVSRMEDLEFISELLFMVLEDGPLEAAPTIIDTLYEKYTVKTFDVPAAEKQFLNITDTMERLGLDYEASRIAGVSHLYGLFCFSLDCDRKNISPESASPKLVQFFEELRANKLKNSNVTEYKKSMSSRTKSKSMRENRLKALVGYVEGTQSGGQ